MWRRWYVVFVLCIAGSAFAGEISFFGGNIDYWGKPKVQASVTAEPAGKREAFPWALYLDPVNKEFFREGDYTPPEPFMEIARDPSDQNIARWFAYIEKKNAIATRLNARMQDYAARIGRPSAMPPQDDRPQVGPINVTPAEFVLRFYFDPACPHCRKMFQTVHDLQAGGFQIEGRQLAGDLLSKDVTGFPVTMASPNEAEQQGVTSVPQLLIASKSAGRVFRIKGYVTASEVLHELSGK